VRPRVCLATPLAAAAATAAPTANERDHPAAGALGSHSVLSGPNLLRLEALHARCDSVPSRLVDACANGAQEFKIRALEFTAHQRKVGRASRLKCPSRARELSRVQIF
jgi:hypothetical protein